MTIRVGDLVMIVHEHCAQQRAIGLIVNVERVDPSYSLRCVHCGESIGYVAAAVVNNGHCRSGWMPLAWLKKINPLSAPEHIERSEEIT